MLFLACPGCVSQVGLRLIHTEGSIADFRHVAENDYVLQNSTRDNQLEDVKYDLKGVLT